MFQRGWDNMLCKHWLLSGWNKFVKFKLFVNNCILYFQNADAYVNAGFVAKVDKSTMTVNTVRIVYGGIEPHAVRAIVPALSLFYWQNNSSII